MVNDPAANSKIVTYFKKLAARVLPGELRLNLALLTGATALSQGFVVLASPLITRLYTSTDFGYLQVYLSTSVFFAVVVALRYEAAVLLPPDDETAANLVVLSLTAILAMGLLFSGAIWLTRDSVIFGARTAGIRPYLWIIPVSACGSGVYQTLVSWALRKKQFRDVAATKITQAAGNISTQLILGFGHVGVVGLLLGEVVGRASGILRLGRAAWHESEPVFRQVSLGKMRRAGVRYKQFPLVNTCSALINTAGFSIPVLLIGSFHGAAVLGWFALADRVVQTPSALVGTAMSQVYMASAARLVHEDPAALLSLFKKTSVRLFIVGIVPCLLFVCLGPGLFSLAFGAHWREAGLYARLLAGVDIVGFTAWPLIPTLVILGQQPLQLAWDTTRVLATCTVLYGAHWSGWSPQSSIAVYAATMATFYGAHLLLSYRALADRVRRSQTEPMPLSTIA